MTIKNILQPIMFCFVGISIGAFIIINISRAAEHRYFRISEGIFMSSQTAILLIVIFLLVCIIKDVARTWTHANCFWMIALFSVIIMCIMVGDCNWEYSNVFLTTAITYVLLLIFGMLFLNYFVCLENKAASAKSCIRRRPGKRVSFALGQSSGRSRSSKEDRTDCADLTTLFPNDEDNESSPVEDPQRSTAMDHSSLNDSTDSAVKLFPNDKPEQLSLDEPSNLFDNRDLNQSTITRLETSL